MSDKFELVNIDEEIVCMPIMTKEGCFSHACFITNGASKYAVRLILSNTEGVTVQYLIDEIVNKYNVSLSELCIDMEEFLTELNKSGVIELYDC